MNGYEEKIKDCLFLEVCNAAGREEWDGLAHQQKENLMLDVYKRQAVPCVEYILCGIAYFLERQEGERDVHIPG